MSVPPGASYRLSNAAITLKRRILNLEDPVRIRYDLPWEHLANPVFDWYARRGGSDCFVSSMQLRKEHEGPFFHEYIVFSLERSERCYRIDRRQLPDESVPLDSIYTTGVEAYDTIEQITSFDDSAYGSSDPRIALHFSKESLPLATVLKVCEAIQVHPKARIYTLQRFNCFFMAQTIITWAACWPHRHDPLASKSLEDLDKFRSTKRVKKYLVSGTSQTTWRDLAYLIPLYSYFDHEGMTSEEISYMQLGGTVQKYIKAHSHRVGLYRVVLGCSPEEVARDISLAMCDIWEALCHWDGEYRAEYGPPRRHPSSEWLRMAHCTRESWAERLRSEGLAELTEEEVKLIRDVADRTRKMRHSLISDSQHSSGRLRKKR